MSYFLNNLYQTIYCERGVSVAFWAEPVNAMTNIVFLIVGFLATRLLIKTKSDTKEMIVLPWLFAGVGVGSFIYHTAHSPSTLALDALPIYIFILYVLFLVLSWLTKNKIKSALILLGFVMCEITLSLLVPKEFLNGSIRHITAFMFISVICSEIFRQRSSTVAFRILSVLGLYALAIFFRSIDSYICTWWQYGSHFLWHIFAALAGYQAIYTLSLMKQQKQDTLRD